MTFHIGDTHQSKPSPVTIEIAYWAGAAFGPVPVLKNLARYEKAWRRDRKHYYMLDEETDACGKWDPEDHPVLYLARRRFIVLKPIDGEPRSIFNCPSILRHVDEDK